MDINFFGKGNHRLTKRWVCWGNEAASALWGPLRPPTCGDDLPKQELNYAPRLLIIMIPYFRGPQALGHALVPGHGPFIAWLQKWQVSMWRAGEQNFTCTSSGWTCLRTCKWSMSAPATQNYPLSHTPAQVHQAAKVRDCCLTLSVQGPEL